MMVTLEIDAAVLKAAREEAQKQGRTETELLSEALRQHYPFATPHQSVSPSEADAILAEMHLSMRNAPVLPANAFSRESFYDE